MIAKVGSIFNYQLSISNYQSPHAPYQQKRQDLLPRNARDDAAKSAELYSNVFGWNIRKRGDGATAFDDTTGEVSGAWVIGRPASPAPGLLFYIMVDSVEAAVKSLVAAGGTIVQPLGVDAPEITARFRDPGGNIIGLSQEPPKSR